MRAISCNFKERVSILLTDNGLIVSVISFSPSSRVLSLSFSSVSSSLITVLKCCHCQKILRVLVNVALLVL
jgi:hypothetical protein